MMCIKEDAKQKVKDIELYIRKEPIKSSGIAAGVGLGLGLIIGYAIGRKTKSRLD